MKGVAMVCRMSFQVLRTAWLLMRECTSPTVRAGWPLRSDVRIEALDPARVFASDQGLAILAGQSLSTSLVVRQPEWRSGPRRKEFAALD